MLDSGGDAPALPCLHGLATSVTRMLESLYEDPLTAYLGEIRGLALLLVGERDPMGPRASEALGPWRASLERLRGLGHRVHAEAPGALAERTLAWLARRGLEETR